MPILLSPQHMRHDSWFAFSVSLPQTILLASSRNKSMNDSDRHNKMYNNDRHRRRDNDKRRDDRWSTKTDEDTNAEMDTNTNTDTEKNTCTEVNVSQRHRKIDINKRRNRIFKIDRDNDRNITPSETETELHMYALALNHAYYCQIPGFLTKFLKTMCTPAMNVQASSRHRPSKTSRASRVFGEVLVLRKASSREFCSEFLNIHTFQNESHMFDIDLFPSGMAT